MNSKISKIKFYFFIFIFSLLLFPIISIDALESTAKSLKEGAIELSEDNLSMFNIDYSKVNTDDIYDYEHCNINGEINAECHAELNKNYVITYEDALNYNGNILTLKVEVKWIYTSDEENFPVFTSGSRKRINYIYLGENQRVFIYSGSPYGTNVRDEYTKLVVKISFYDKSGNPFKFSGTFGILDPDGINLLFDTNDRNIFYITAEKQDVCEGAGFEDSYFITENSIERNLELGYCFYINAFIGVELKDETSFTYTMESISSEGSFIPYLYFVPSFNIETEAVNGIIDSSNIVVNGDDITINYHEKDGYVLKSVKVDGEEVDINTNKNSYTFQSVSENHKILVEYEIDKNKSFNINTSVINGTIDPLSVVEYDNNITINYKPTTGYVLKSIKVDGKSIDIKNNKSSYTFEKVKENHEIIVEYEFENPQTGTLQTVIKLGLSIGIIGVIILAKSLRLI